MKQNEILLLKLLSIRDQYGYELEKMIEYTQMRYWSEIGFSSIYAALNSLAKGEYISFSYKKEAGSPRRKVYHLEEKGAQALAEGIREFIAKPKPLFPDLHVGVIMAEKTLTADEYREALLSYRERLLQYRSRFAKDCSEFIHKKKGVASVYKRMQLMMTADLQWIDEELEE